MERTFLALLAYHGGAFHGWQRQPSCRTVQAELEAALSTLADRPVQAEAAGRTDAGVHALAMPVSFRMPARWAPAALTRSLNALLPADCWVSETIETGQGFRARFAATARRYRYLLGTDPAARSPFRRPLEWALCRPVSLLPMQEAAVAILGTHDFESFSVRGQPLPHHRCSVHVAEWSARQEGAGLAFEIEADRFLHHMVRMIVGTMVEIGMGRRPVADIEALLGARDNRHTSPPAPPQGLYFVRASYPAELLHPGERTARA